MSNSGATRFANTLGIQLSLLAGVQIVFSFFTQWYLVIHFGAERQTDALFAGATIPQVITVLLIESLIAVMVPILSGLPAERLPEVAAALLILMLGVFTAIVLLMLLAAPLAVWLLVPGFSEEAKEVTVNLTRIQAFGILGGAASAVLATLCQVRGRFRRPLIATLVGVVVGLIVLVWFAPIYGLESAAWSQVVATILPAFVLVRSAGPLGKPNWNVELLKTLWQKAKPIIAGKLYFFTSVPLDRFLASFLAPGSLVIFDLAGRFYLAVLRVLGQGTITPMIPELSRLAHANRWLEYQRGYRKQAQLMLIPGLLVTGLVLTGGAVVLVLTSGTADDYLIGRLRLADVRQICTVLMLLSGILPAQGLVNLFNTAFYAQGDTATPTRIGVVMFTAGVSMKLMGMWLGGLVGLTAAVTVSTAVHCYVLKRRLNCRTDSLRQVWYSQLSADGLDGKGSVAGANG